MKKKLLWLLLFAFLFLSFGNLTETICYAADDDIPRVFSLHGK